MFNPTQPAWSHFDITTCIRQSNQMFLKVTLDGKLYVIRISKYEYFIVFVCISWPVLSYFIVSYSQLIQFSLQKAHDSIRKALAKATKISPLRLSDLHVSIIMKRIYYKNSFSCLKVFYRS